MLVVLADQIIGTYLPLNALLTTSAGGVLLQRYIQRALGALGALGVSTFPPAMLRLTSQTYRASACAATRASSPTATTAAKDGTRRGVRPSGCRAGTFGNVTVFGSTIAPCAYSLP